MTDNTTIIVHIFWEEEGGDSGRWDYVYKPGKYDVSMGWGFHFALLSALDIYNLPCSPDEVTMVTFDVVEEVNPIIAVLEKHFARYADKLEALEDLYVLLDELEALTGLDAKDIKDDLDYIWIAHEGGKK